MVYILGIDLGTTYSCISAYNVIDNENIIFDKIINCLDNNDNHIIPSYIKYSKININNIDKIQYKIGYDAKNKIDSQTYFNIKRFIGKKYNECISDLKFVPFEYKNDNNELFILFDNKWLKPYEISSLYLKQLKIICEEFLNESVKHCVITIPAYFNNKQREETKQAGIDAGFNVLQLLNEPSAAALSYKLNNSKEDNKILIFDFGGGTLDISILNNTNEGLIVVNTHGNNTLGGEDVDMEIIKYLLSEFIKINKLSKEEIIKLCSNKAVLQLLRKECEKAKKELTYINETYIIIDNFYNGETLNIKLSLETLNKLCLNIINKCQKVLDEALININKNDINDVILIGGSTRLRCIKSFIRNYFNNITIHDDIDPDLSVSYGALIHCFNIYNNNDEIFLIDTVSHSLGFEDKEGNMQVVIPKNTLKPCSKKKYITTANNNQRIIKLNIYEGENKKVKDNIFIKQITYDINKTNLIGENKFEVIYDIDENNIFNISINPL